MTSVDELRQKNNLLSQKQNKLSQKQNQLESNSGNIEEKIKKIGETKDIRDKQADSHKKLQEAQTKLQDTQNDIDKLGTEIEKLQNKNNDNENNNIESSQKSIEEQHNGVEKIQKQIENTQAEINKLQSDFERKLTNQEERSTAVAIFGIASGVSLCLYGVMHGISITADTVQDYKKTFIGDKFTLVKATFGLFANGTGFLAAMLSTQRKDSVFDLWDDYLNGIQIFGNIMDYIEVHYVAKEIGSANAQSQKGLLIELSRFDVANDEERNSLLNSRAYKTQNRPDYMKEHRPSLVSMQNSESGGALKFNTYAGAGLGIVTLVLTIWSFFEDPDYKTKELRCAQYCCIGASQILPTIAMHIKNPKAIAFIALIDGAALASAGAIQIYRSSQ